MPYCQLVTLKLRMQKTDLGDDGILTSLIDIASRKIDSFCGRRRSDGGEGFIADVAASARYYQGRGLAYLLIDECIAISEVAVKDSATDEDYEVWTSPTTNLAGDGDWLAFSGDPDGPDFNSLPYTAIMTDVNGDYSVFTSGRFHRLWRGFRTDRPVRRNVPTVRVTARWGFAATVPGDIEEACMEIVARFYKRMQSSMADSLASADLGALLYRQQIDPDVAGLLLDGRFVRPTATGRR